MHVANVFRLTYSCISDAETHGADWNLDGIKKESDCSRIQSVGRATRHEPTADSSRCGDGRVSSGFVVPSAGIHFTRHIR